MVAVQRLYRYEKDLRCEVPPIEKSEPKFLLRALLRTKTGRKKLHGNDVSRKGKEFQAGIRTKPLANIETVEKRYPSMMS
jgi:hypothetical protein